MGRTKIPKKSQGILETCFGSQIAVETESFSIVGVWWEEGVSFLCILYN